MSEQAARPTQDDDVLAGDGVDVGIEVDVGSSPAEAAVDELEFFGPPPPSSADETQAAGAAQQEVDDVLGAVHAAIDDLISFATSNVQPSSAGAPQARRVVLDDEELQQLLQTCAGPEAQELLQTNDAIVVTEGELDDLAPGDYVGLDAAEFDLDQFTPVTEQIAARPEEVALTDEDFAGVTAEEEEAITHADELVTVHDVEELDVLASEHGSAIDQITEPPVELESAQQTAEPQPQVDLEPLAAPLRRLQMAVEQIAKQTTAPAADLTSLVQSIDQGLTRISHAADRRQDLAPLIAKLDQVAVALQSHSAPHQPAQQLSATMPRPMRSETHRPMSTLVVATVCSLVGWSALLWHHTQDVRIGLGALVALNAAGSYLLLRTSKNEQATTGHSGS
jgi:hypothetical protein